MAAAAHAVITQHTSPSRFNKGGGGEKDEFKSKRPWIRSYFASGVSLCVLVRVCVSVFVCVRVYEDVGVDVWVFECRCWCVRVYVCVSVRLCVVGKESVLERDSYITLTRLFIMY